MSSPLDYYQREFSKFLSSLDVSLAEIPLVQLAQQKTAIRPAVLAIGTGVFLLCFLLYGIGANFVANLVGFCYPLYEAFRSLTDYQKQQKLRKAGVAEGKNPPITQWLTYFVVYSSFSLVESGTNFLHLWIPFYFLMKIAFLVWCFAPSTRGAQVIFSKLIEPILCKYEGKIDEISGKLGQSDADKALENLLEQAKAANEGKKVA